MKFGVWLREARERNNLSRRTFSDSLSISEGTVKNYENGYTIPDDDILFKIAELFKARFIDLWASCHKQEHQRVIAILERAEKEEFRDGSISDPEMLEICAILKQHQGRGL